MRYLLFVSLLPLMAYAGQMEYDKTVAHAKADYDYQIKVCKKMPKKDAKECIDNFTRDYKDELKRLREYYKDK